MKKMATTGKDKLIHDINGKLAVIFGYTQLLQSKIDLNSQEGKWLQIIADECSKLSEYLKKN